MSISLDFKSLRNAFTSQGVDIFEWYSEHLNRIEESKDSGIWIYLLKRERILARIEELRSSDSVDLPLFGIPFAVKDNIDVAGLPTTAACKEYEYIAEKTAPVVDSLLKAGAVLVGKTNMDQFATGLVGVRSPYKIPGNSFNDEYIPGGSSSGSAVAVSKGLVSFSLGTDTAGSGRVPAAFGNIYGYKPSKGLLSTHGVVPACRSLDCVSVFTLSPEDVRTIFPIISKYDEQDPYSRKYAPPDRIIKTNQFTFGVPKEDQLQFFSNEYGAELYRKKCDCLIAVGGKRVEIDFSPFLKAAKLLYEGPWVTERFVAIEDFIKSQPNALHPVTHKIIAGGESLLASDGFKAAYKLAALKKLADQVWNDLDFIITPTAGTCYTREEVEKDPIQTNSNLGYYTNFMNLLNYSAIAIPAGFQENGIPFGVTLFAPAMYDLELAKMAEALRDPELPLGNTKITLTKEETKTVPDNFIELVVCGAHMEGLPLNYQLTKRGGYLLGKAKTTPGYKLYKLPGGPPFRPALVKDPSSNSSITVEVWAIPKSTVGSFLEGIPSPLGLGTVQLQGSKKKGFIAEHNAISDAEDITQYGGWRAFIESV